MECPYTACMIYKKQKTSEQSVTNVEIRYKPVNSFTCRFNEIEFLVLIFHFIVSPVTDKVLKHSLTSYITL